MSIPNHAPHATAPVQVYMDLGRALPPPHLSPRDVVIDSLDAVEEGLEDVFPGELTNEVAKDFAADPKAVQARLSAIVPTRV